MKKIKWFLLQIFAEGGEGSAASGEGAAVADTGVNDAAAGHQRLRELGVPENKLRKNRSYKVSNTEEKSVEAGQTESQAKETKVQDDSAESTPPEAKSSRMTWEEIKADPEYSEQMNKMVRERVKKYQGSDAAMTVLEPAIKLLAKHYGQDLNNIDHAALAESINKDRSRYSDRAAALGVENDDVYKMDLGEIAESDRGQQERERQKDIGMQAHYAGLRVQAEEFAKKCPGFNLDKELDNPAFMKLTAPGIAFSIEDAYNFVHREEIAQAAMQTATENARMQMANSIRAGTMRPVENGSNAVAPSVTSIDWRSASPQQRMAMRKRIQMAAARGEKIYPGQF